jgi:hypothetical protein
LVIKVYNHLQRIDTSIYAGIGILQILLQAQKAGGLANWQSKIKRIGEVIGH